MTAKDKWTQNQEQEKMSSRYRNETKTQGYATYRSPRMGTGAQKNRLKVSLRPTLLQN